MSMTGEGTPAAQVARHLGMQEQDVFLHHQSHPFAQLVVAGSAVSVCFGVRFKAIFGQAPAGRGVFIDSRCLGRPVVHRSVQAHRLTPADVCAMLDVPIPDGYSAFCEGALDCGQYPGYFLVDHGMSIMIWIDRTTPPTTPADSEPGDAEVDDDVGGSDDHDDQDDDMGHDQDAQDDESHSRSQGGRCTAAPSVHRSRSPRRRTQATTTEVRRQAQAGSDGLLPSSVCAQPPLSKFFEGCHSMVCGQSAQCLPTPCRSLRLPREPCTHVSSNAPLGSSLCSCATVLPAGTAVQPLRLIVMYLARQLSPCPCSRVGSSRGSCP